MRARKLVALTDDLICIVIQPFRAPGTRWSMRFCGIRGPKPKDRVLAFASLLASSEKGSSPK